MIPGFVESIQQYETAPLLNLDISNKILNTETVLDLMLNVYHRHETDGSFQDDLTRQLVGQIVMTRYVVYEPRHEKTCLRGFQPGQTQNGLLSFRS